MMQLNGHYDRTKAFFRESAVERQGFYDGSPGVLEHTFWQMRMRRMVIQYLSGIITSGGSMKSLLDAGCGRGDFIKEIALKFPHLTEIGGTDFSGEALDIGRADLSGERRVFFKEADLLHLPFDDGRFDIVTCINVIHHVHHDDFAAALSELSRITRHCLIVEIKNLGNIYWRYLHPPRVHGIDIFPVTIAETAACIEPQGFRLSSKLGIFGFPVLSPIVTLVFQKEKAMSIPA